ncbi:MAG: hypothetical protein ABJB74_22875 [Gemmatimonas sp.]
MLGAFDRRERMVAQSARTWAKTGVVPGRAATASIGAPWQKNLLLAHTAREFCWCLIARDKHFHRVRPPVKGLRVEAQFPRRPSIARGNERCYS